MEHNVSVVLLFVLSDMGTRHRQRFISAGVLADVVYRKI
jgi:hypothetical protein